MRTFFDQLNDAYAKFYSPSEYLTVNKVIVLFKGRVIFKHYTPKTHKMPWYKNLWTLWHDWLYVRCEFILDSDSEKSD